MAEGERCADGLVRQWPAWKAEAVRKDGVGYIMAGEEPEFNHAGQPQRRREIGQLGTFRGRSKIEDIFDAGGQSILEAEASEDAFLGFRGEHIRNLLRA